MKELFFHAPIIGVIKPKFRGRFRGRPLWRAKANPYPPQISRAQNERHPEAPSRVLQASYIGEMRLIAARCGNHDDANAGANPNSSWRSLSLDDALSWQR